MDPYFYVFMAWAGTIIHFLISVASALPFRQRVPLEARFFFSVQRVRTDYGNRLAS